MWIAERVEHTKFPAIRDGWYRPPANLAKETRRAPDTPVAREIEAQEGSAFAAFLGAHQQVAKQIGKG